MSEPTAAEHAEKVSTEELAAVVLDRMGNPRSGGRAAAALAALLTLAARTEQAEAKAERLAHSEAEFYRQAKKSNERAEQAEKERDEAIERAEVAETLALTRQLSRAEITAERDRLAAALERLVERSEVSEAWSETKAAREALAQTQGQT